MERLPEERGNPLALNFCRGNTRDVEAFLKKTAIAYHPNPHKRAKLGGMQ